MSHKNTTATNITLRLCPTGSSLMTLRGAGISTPARVELVGIVTMVNLLILMILLNLILIYPSRMSRRLGIQFSNQYNAWYCKDDYTYPIDKAYIKWNTKCAQIDHLSMPKGRGTTVVTKMFRTMTPLISMPRSSTKVVTEVLSGT